MNFAEPLIDGHRILPQLLADIGRARHTVHVSFFLFFNDPIGIEVADALIAARQRGAAVRVLLNMEKTAMGDPFSTGERDMVKHVPEVDWNPLDTKPLSSHPGSGCAGSTPSSVKCADSCGKCSAIR